MINKFEGDEVRRSKLMAKKYVYISLIPAVIWFLTVLYFYEESKILLLLLGPPILFVMLCYIIGLLKDMKANPVSKENDEEEGKKGE